MQWTARDLLWWPARCLGHLFEAIHPTRGRLILMSTDCSVGLTEVIRFYALRFKIELSPKHALHTVDNWAYHFWMRSCNPLGRGTGAKFFHHSSRAHRTAVWCQLAACHRQVYIGPVARKTPKYLTTIQPDLVWHHCSS